MGRPAGVCIPQIKNLQIRSAGYMVMIDNFDIVHVDYLITGAACSLQARIAASMFEVAFSIKATS
jgi:hypothetical protein